MSDTKSAEKMSFSQGELCDTKEQASNTYEFKKKSRESSSLCNYETSDLGISSNAKSNNDVQTILEEFRNYFKNINNELSSDASMSKSEKNEHLNRECSHVSMPKLKKGKLLEDVHLNDVSISKTKKKKCLEDQLLTSSNFKNSVKKKKLLMEEKYLNDELTNEVEECLEQKSLTHDPIYSSKNSKKKKKVFVEKKYLNDERSNQVLISKSKEKKDGLDKEISTDVSISDSKKSKKKKKSPTRKDSLNDEFSNNILITKSKEENKKKECLEQDILTDVSVSNSKKSKRKKKSFMKEDFLNDELSNNVLITESKEENVLITESKEENQKRKSLEDEILTDVSNSKKSKKKKKSPMDKDFLNDEFSNNVLITKSKGENKKRECLEQEILTDVSISNSKKSEKIFFFDKDINDYNLANNDSSQNSANNDLNNSYNFNIMHQKYMSDSCSDFEDKMLKVNVIEKNIISQHQSTPSLENSTTINVTDCDTATTNTDSVIEEDEDNSNYFQNVNQDSYFSSYAEKEFISFDIPPLHEKESVSLPSKEMLNDWKSRNIRINSGKWSRKEILILKRNFLDFITRYKVSDPFFLLGLGQKSRSKQSLDFLRNTRFYVQLGKDLNNRTLRSIYIKARSLFHPFREKNTAKTDEIDYIIEKQIKIGNKWTKIGKKLDRSGTNCSEVFRWNGKKINKGNWSYEEIETLTSALQKVTGSSDFSDYSQLKDISWNKVSELVPTRNFSQCRQFWAMHLTWKKDIKERKKWKKSSSARLVYILKTYFFVKDEVKIDWEKIQQSFQNVSPSSFFLRKKWQYLKTHKARAIKSYRGKVDFLYDRYKQKIEKILLEKDIVML